MAEFMDVHRGMVDITPEGLRRHIRPISPSRATNTSTSSTRGQTEVGDGLLPVRTEEEGHHDRGAGGGLPALRVVVSLDWSPIMP
jgi:hypothetical protein